MKIAIQNTTTLDLFTSFLTLSADYKYVIPFSIPMVIGMRDYSTFIVLNQILTIQFGALLLKKIFN